MVFRRMNVLAKHRCTFNNSETFFRVTSEIDTANNEPCVFLFCLPMLLSDWCWFQQHDDSDDTAELDIS